MGFHHKVAHVLGGSFHIPHASAHTVMLPHSIHFNAPDARDAVARIAKALGAADGDAAAAMYDLLKAVGAPTHLREFGFTTADVKAAAAAVVEGAGSGNYPNPRPVASNASAVQHALQAAQLGRRPSKDMRYVSSDEVVVSAMAPHAVPYVPVAVTGAPLESAKTVLLCVHGRYASAERIIQQVQGSIGRVPGVAFVAPQAVDSQWYTDRFTAPLENNEPGLSSSLHLLDDVFAWLRDQGVPASRVVVVGFSQGACLAAEWVARRGHGNLAALVVLSGGLIGPEKAGGLPMTAYKHYMPGLHVFFSVAKEDAHVPLIRVRQSASAFVSKDASVVTEFHDGSAHKIYPSADAHLRMVVSRAVAGSKVGVAVADGADGADGAGSADGGDKAAAAAGTGAGAGAGAGSGHGGRSHHASAIVLDGTVMTVRSGGGGHGSDPYKYVSGFGNTFSMEAVAGVLPRTCNVPRKLKFGLATEIVTGDSFAATRARSCKAALYRLQPTVDGAAFVQLPAEAVPRLTNDFSGVTATPELWRSPAIDVPDASHPVDFVHGLNTIAGCGDPLTRNGMAIHWYACNRSMGDR